MKDGRSVVLKVGKGSAGFDVIRDAEDGIWVGKDAPSTRSSDARVRHALHPHQDNARNGLASCPNRTSFHHPEEI